MAGSGSMEMTDEQNNDLMIEGYIAMAEENLAFAEMYLEASEELLRTLESENW